MKKNVSKIISFTIAAALIIIGFAAYKTFNKTASMPKTDGATTVISIEQDMKKGALLLDVREPDEFAAGHAPGALNVPVGDIVNGKFKEDTSKKIYLYCRSGNRAGEAETALRSRGFADVKNLGGLAEWQNMGGQFVR